MEFELATDKQVLQELGARLRRIRLSHNLAQEEVALRSGVSLSALKRLEAGGNVQVLTLLGVAKSLSVLRDLETAFVRQPPITIADLERMHKSGQRERARKKRVP